MKQIIKIDGIAEFEIESKDIDIKVKLKEGYKLNYKLTSKDNSVHEDSFEVDGISETGWAYNGVRIWMSPMDKQEILERRRKKIKKSNKLKKQRKLKKLVVHGKGAVGIKLTGKPNKPIKVDEINVTGGGVGIEM